MTYTWILSGRKSASQNPTRKITQPKSSGQNPEKKIVLKWGALRAFKLIMMHPHRYNIAIRPITDCLEHSKTKSGLNTLALLLYVEYHYTIPLEAITSAIRELYGAGRPNPYTAEPQYSLQYIHQMKNRPEYSWTGKNP